MSTLRADHIGTLQRWLTFGSVMLASFGYAVASTIATTLLPQMQGALSASLDQISWVITASVVAGAIGLPPTPWLKARFGLKPVLIVSLLAFTVASAMIGVSTSLGEVVFWRVCQAFFGAPIPVLAQTLSVTIFPFERRGTVLSIWSVVMTIGWVFAPVFGAYLADWQSWRVAFLAVPLVSLLATIACLYFVSASKRNEALRFDWMGFIALSIGLTALQVVLNRGQQEYWFESDAIVAWTLLAAISLYVYAAHTLTTTKGFVSWEVFKDRNTALSIVLTVILAFVSLAPLVLLPPLLAHLRGLEVLTIGLILIPGGVVQVIGNLLIAPVLTRWDPRAMLAFGFSCYAAGSFLMASYNLDIGIWDLVLPQLLQGIAMTFIWMPIFHLIYVTLAPELRTDAVTLINLVYNLVGSAAVALLVTLLSRSRQINSEELGANVTLTNEALRFPEYSMWDLKELESLASLQAEIGLQAMMIGYVNVFWVLAWASLAGLPLLLLIPSHAARKRAVGEPAAQRAS